MSILNIILGSAELPMYLEQTRVQALDAAALDSFGYSVALSSDGNTMAVGANGDDNSGGTDAGSVYVFVRSGTTWTQQARLQGSEAINKVFGKSVALSSDGNTLAVGAQYIGTPNIGVAYVFVRSGTTWTEQAKIHASDAAYVDYFGRSVALSSDGNTMAVGAYWSGSGSGGTVYMFTRSGTTWTQQARVQASDVATSDYFGWSVALSSDGNTMAVGANGDGNSGGDYAGSVYVFTRSGTTWAEQARVQASDAVAYDYFGYSVALSSDGNTLAVGAIYDDNSGGTDAGSAYVFTRSGTTWAQQARVQASDASYTDFLGASVALSADGNTMAVGRTGGANRIYALYVFVRSGTTWTQQARVQASDAAAYDDFGWSVALSSDGNTMAVGSHSDDNSGGSNAGSVYVLQTVNQIPSATPYSSQMKMVASDAAVDDYFGRCVVLSRDGNTMAVGALLDNNSGGADAGSVYVLVRSGTTWTQQARVQASDAAASDYFGYSVALSSDGNTMAVGANGDDNSGGSNAGSVYVFVRSGTTWTEQARVQASDASYTDFFGASVALSADGNTMAVGRTGAANRIYALYVFVRSGTTWTEQARIQATSNMGSYFGTSVSLSADGNTLAASAYGETSAEATKAGAAYIYVRSGTTWTQQARVQALTPVASSQFGYSVALSLDGNTLAVGANLTVGSAYVFVRSGTTWSQQARMEALDGASNNYFGNSVALTSDGNTLAVGAQMAANSGGSTAGSAYIFTRAGSTWSPSQLRIQAFDAAQGDQFGASITLSADGSMVAVGSPSDASGTGSVYAFYK